MNLNSWDLCTFLAFTAFVIIVSLWASRREKTSEDYFLAGRNLSWWLIGFSLIASNISTEHFVGMSGAAFGNTGLAIASYEWFAAVTLVVVALFLLPVFLRLGIFTMPEFLEKRYGPGPRLIMAIFMMVAYIGVALASVLYSGAIGLNTIFGMELVPAIWFIGICAGVYTVYGGLKAVVWSDLIQGSALLIGGAFVMFLGLEKIGGFDVFLSQNTDKLHLILPADHPDIPWTALLFGIWIPHFFYWGFNQFITQRTLGARSLAEGQNGILFAAFLKLLIPFIVVFPGIVAFQLYGDSLQNGDQAYSVLVKNILPEKWRGLMFAALFGAVMSSLDSMLNSASTIFTMDIFKRHIRPQASTQDLLKTGRYMTAALVILGCLIAPLPAHFSGVFHYIQMIWGFISPGIVVVFVFGLVFRRAPALAASIVMLLGIPVYGGLLWVLPKTAFLNHMGITFVVLSFVMGLLTWLRPLPEPVVFDKTEPSLDMTPSRLAKPLGILVVVLTALLYLRFW